MFVLAGISGVVLAAEGLRVDNLSFNATAEGLTVYIKTSGPISTYRCDLNPPASRQGERTIVFDLPGAESDLESFGDLAGDLLLAADVERSLDEGRGVRIRFLLDKGVLTQFEEVSQGLLLYFEKSEPQDGSWGGGGSEAYRLGVGDQLEISVFGHDDLHRTTEVRADGTINYPLLGDILVGGEPIAKVKEIITTSLARDYLVDPQVNVEVREYRSQWVTVIGAVRSPSRYVLVRNMQLIDLLAAAGGLSGEAGSDIFITRRDPASTASRQIVVAREDLFSRDNRAANISLAPGDIITVSERDFFYIRGEVNRPDAYIFKNGMTVLKAISIAGGFSQFANRKEVELLRTDDGGVHHKTIVNIKAIEDGKQEDLLLLPEDMIIVPRRIF
jgi:polysaccharide export outer membrane protein